MSNQKEILQIVESLKEKVTNLEAEINKYKNPRRPLRADQAAAICGVAVQTMYDEYLAGNIPGKKIKIGTQFKNGFTLSFLLEDVITYRDQGFAYAKPVTQNPLDNLIDVPSNQVSRGLEDLIDQSQWNKLGFS